MSLIMVEHILRGWLWVAPISLTIGYILPGELACLIIVLSCLVD